MVFLAQHAFDQKSWQTSILIDMVRKFLLWDNDNRKIFLIG